MLKLELAFLAVLVDDDEVVVVVYKVEVVVPPITRATSTPLDDPP